MATPPTPSQRFNWRAHAVILGLGLAADLVYAVVAATAGNSIGAAVGFGIALFGLLALLAYGAVTSVLLLLVARRRGGFLIVHLGVAGVLALGAWTIDSMGNKRSDAERLARYPRLQELNGCLHVRQLEIHHLHRGVELTLENVAGCPSITFESVSVVVLEVGEQTNLNELIRVDQKPPITIEPGNTTKLLLREPSDPWLPDARSDWQIWIHVTEPAETPVSYWTPKQRGRLDGLIESVVDRKDL